MEKQIIYGNLPIELSMKAENINDLKVYNALASFQGVNDCCFPLRSQIAERSGIKERAVSTAITSLVKSGWLTRRKEKSGRCTYIAHKTQVQVTSTCKQSARANNKHMQATSPTQVQVIDTSQVQAARTCFKQKEHCKRTLENNTSYAPKQKRKHTPNQNQFWPTAISPPKEARAKDSPEKEKSEYQETMAELCKLHKRETGEMPQITARSGASLKRMLKEHGREAIIARAERLSEKRRCEKASYWRDVAIVPHRIEERWHELPPPKKAAWEIRLAARKDEDRRPLFIRKEMARPDYGLVTQEMWDQKEARGFPYPSDHRIVSQEEYEDARRRAEAMEAAS